MNIDQFIGRFCAVSFVVVVGLLAAGKCAASDFHVQVHGLSYHTERTQANGDKWNERNYGLGLRYQVNDAWDVQAGAFKNSQFKTSAYAIATWLPVEVTKELRAGMFGGVVNGYRLNDGRAVPAGGLAARYQAERLSVTWRFVPKHPKTDSAVISIELGWRL